MPPSYQITIKNKSGKPEVYSLFTEPPHTNGDKDHPKLSSAFAPGLGPTQSPDGVTVFTVPAKYYAICTTSSAPLGTGVPILTTDSMAVNLGSESPPVKASIVGLTVDKNGYPKLEEPIDSQEPGQPAGGFVIKAGSFNKAANPGT